MRPRCPGDVQKTRDHISQHHTGEGGFWRNKLQFDHSPDPSLDAQVMNFDAKEVTGLYSYRGLDNEERWTTLEWSEPAKTITPGVVRFEYDLPPHSPATLSLAIRCERVGRACSRSKACRVRAGQ